MGEERVVEGRVRELAAGAGGELPPVRVTGDDPVPPSVFRVGTAAAVGAATAAAAALGGGGSEAAVDVREAAIAFRDERHFRINGLAADPWAPLSGDYRAFGGWVRLHCNFDHHRNAALVALGCRTMWAGTPSRGPVRAVPPSRSRRQ